MTEPKIEKPVTKVAWKKRRRHEGITCPSGAVVTVEIPDLNALISSGYLPNELLTAAVKLSQGDNSAATDPDSYRQESIYKQKLVIKTVVEPKLDETDFGDDGIPQEDIEFLTQIATRQRDMDAAGKHIGGLEKIQSFRDLRGIYSGVEAS